MAGRAVRGPHANGRRSLGAGRQTADLALSCVGEALLNAFLFQPKVLMRESSADVIGEALLDAFLFQPNVPMRESSADVIRQGW